MIIRYTPAQGELIRAARAWEGQHWPGARYIMAAFLLSSGGYLLYCDWAWWGALFCVFGLLEAFNLLPAAVLRTIIDFRMNPKFRNEYELTLTKENLRFRTASIDSTLSWDLYSGVIETEEVFILTIGGRMSTVIPKRAFPNNEQIQEVRQLLSAAVAPPKSVA